MSHFSLSKGLFWIGVLYLSLMGMASASTMNFVDAYIYNHSDPRLRTTRAVFVTVKNHSSRSKQFVIKTVVYGLRQDFTSRRFSIGPRETKSIATQLRGHSWNRYNGRRYTAEIYLHDMDHTRDHQDKWVVRYVNRVGQSTRSVRIRETRRAEPRPRPRVSERETRPRPATPRPSISNRRPSQDLQLAPNFRIGSTTHRARGVFGGRRRARFSAGHVRVRRVGRNSYLIGLTTSSTIVNRGSRFWNNSIFLATSLREGVPGRGLRSACSTGSRGRVCPSVHKNINIRLQPGRTISIAQHIGNINGYQVVRAHRWYTLFITLGSRNDQNRNNNRAAIAFQFDRNGRITRQRAVNPNARTR